jgi:hypothetical protein
MVSGWPWAIGVRASGDRLFELAGVFRRLLAGLEGFTLVREPGNQRLLPLFPPAERGLEEARRRREHELTIAIRQRLLESGRFMLNYAPLDGAATLRIVLSNPRTTEADLVALLDAIEACAESSLELTPAQPGLTRP